jgi:glycosyltransferase involved in cell wall biosynthesis
MALISVIVCSHNPRDAYLLRCLHGLRSQTLDMKSWELLLVDNVSAQPLELKADISWHPNSRHVREFNLGLIWARCRGIQESIGEILVFVDDDNVLDSDYLFKASELGNKWPILGAWGAGLVSPEFEVEPAAHLKEFLPFLAIRQVSDPRWSNVLPCVEATPWGAGLCVRRSVAEAYWRLGQESKHPITGRMGNVLLSGDDIELCYVASKLGFGVGIFPELKVLHLIPKERISEPYLVKIAEGTMISNILLDYKWFGTSPRPLFSASGLLSLASLAKSMLTTNGIHRQIHIANWRAGITAGKLLRKHKPANQ